MINIDQTVSDKAELKSGGIQIFDYLYVLVLIIYGGLASNFVRSFGPERPLALLLPVILSTILALKSRIVFNRQIFLLLLFYLIYNFALAIKFKSVYPIFFGRLLVNFLITYISVKALRLNFFIIYERLMFYLTIIALFMWVIQLSMGGDNLLNMLAGIPSINTFSAVTGKGLNIILYSVQPSYHMISSGSTIARNCGFAWEPGGFAIYLCLAIFINLFFIKSKVKFNFRFWIFILGLLSTQSTTGYVIFILIMIFFVFQENMKVVFVLLPFLILITAFLLSLPFMRDKIVTYIGEASRVDVIVEESVGLERARAPQRFASFVIAFRDFVNNPVLGYGGQTDARWYYKLGSNISPISGIGNLLAQYGLVGFLFFIILLFRSSSAYSHWFNYNGSYLFFLIMLLITVSYSVILIPVIMFFWMFPFFANTREDESGIVSMQVNEELNSLKETD